MKSIWNRKWKPKIGECSCVVVWAYFGIAFLCHISLTECEGRGRWEWQTASGFFGMALLWDWDNASFLVKRWEKMLASELQLLGIAAGGPYDQLVSTIRVSWSRGTALSLGRLLCAVIYVASLTWWVETTQHTSSWQSDMVSFSQLGSHDTGQVKTPGGMKHLA